MILIDIIKLKLRLRRETFALEGWIAMGAREVALQQALLVVRKRKFEPDTLGFNTVTALRRVEDELTEMIEENAKMKASFADRIQRARTGR